MLRIIVPFHNTLPWLPQCLESIRQQTVRDWRCHLADDCSNDGSNDIVNEFVGSDPRFIVSTNMKRLYHCGTYERLLSDSSWSGRDICVSVDADDYLPDNQVLERVLAAYADGQTWLTWGSYRETGGEMGVCGPLEDTGRIRQVPWRTSHLRTWQLFLWRMIRAEDFLGPDNEPLRVAGDLACMFPMVEMAGNRHVKFLESINYIYNCANPLSNFRIREAEQRRNRAFLRSKPAYSPLPDHAGLSFL